MSTIYKVGSVFIIKRKAKPMRSYRQRLQTIVYCPAKAPVEIHWHKGANS